MMRWFLSRSLNQRLALLAVLLGAVALFATPAPGGRVTLDARELGQVVGRGADRVPATEVAGWIVESRADYRLVDLRPEAEFARYHIPGAVNVPVAALVDASLGRQETLVLYSEDGTQSIQAWMLLRARGYRAAYILEGGLSAWRNDVLSPVLTDNPTPDQKARDERRRTLSAYFGGQPRQASAAAAGAPSAGAESTMPAAPKVVPPAPGAGPAKVPPKKKKEGC